MHKPRNGLAPPAAEIHDFTLDEEDAKVFLRPGEVSMVSPLSHYIQSEHQHAGLFSMPQDPVRKKRKRCGVCGPCMRTENCGTCNSCINRKVAHQICKLRKCEELKKRRVTWQKVDHFDDVVRAHTLIPNLATETVSVVGSVDGPSRSGQMEIDHGCLEKGVLNQELSNGLSQHGEEINDLEGGALAKLSHQHQETLTCLPQTQGWGPGDLKGAPTPQQQETNWSDQSTSSVGNSVDMENARTLVAFSASAGSLPPCSVPQPSHNPNTELYEKFNQEMANRGNGDKQKTWSGDDQHCTEDLKTLQMALNQARHGQKPPSCDCDGPDCPDYLEWLEKKIKIAGNCQEKGLCKLSGTSQTEQQHYQSQPQSQLSGANTSCGSEPQSQNPVTQSPVPKLYGPLPPIPCSPSVLSIAKERNVSLQTAIAIEALTQLSGTGGPAGDSPLGNSDHHASPQPPSQTQDDLQFISSAPRSLSSSSASTIPQSLSSRHFPQQNSALWEQHRPESQGSAQHPSQYQSTTSPFSTSHPSTPNPSPHQWQQSTGASCEKNSPRTPWMLNTETQACFPHSSRSSSDPMSELKQLLGDSSGKYTSTTFKFPAPPQNLKDNHSMMPHIKQEVNNGEYPGEMGAAMGQYRILSSQQQFQSQQIPQSIRYSTQAALQQHLHHKRNLFSGSQSFAQHTPMTCQTLRKWWPQSTPESPLTIKQEPREPKKKKNTQSSPLLKQSLGGLLGSLGPSLPKPKQIIIKKHKQKASQPVFLPQSQITVQKSLSQNMPPLPFMEAAVPPCPPPHNSSQVVVSQAAPAQSQESILNSSHTPISESLTLASNPPDVPVPPAQDELTSSNPTTLSEDPLATTSASQITTSESTPPLCGLNSLDPKFEEILRQFEEEFGDTPAPVTDAPEQDFTSYMETESHQNSNSGQSRPQSPSTEKVNNISAPTTEPEPSLKQAEGENEEMSVSSNQLPVIKQDTTECEVDVKPPDELLALATEAYLQQQHHKILVNPFTTTCSPPNKRMKIESSGGVTVLSTAGNFSTTEENLDTPTKESFPSSPSLKGFLESPLRYLDTPTKSLLDTPVKNAQAEFPLCDCVEHIIEKDEGPYYNHLGSGPTVASIRELMENRYGEKGEAVRIEKVVFTGREGKSSQGCPIAKWVIRRSGEKEKLLCLVRQRAGHHCANAVIIVVILAWEGIPRALGDKLYQEVTETITKYGNATSRRCGLNDDRTCACQGKDTETCGASFSFGCSWSMYFNGCKYARSKAPRKFRLQGEHPKEEELLRDNFQELATKVAPVYKRLAPQGYQNQCATEKMAPDCRLGLKEGRPFSGITACMDFCAHAHKDQHNLHNGCTVVCTLTKEDNRKLGIIPEDEQLHVLPLYKISLTDEFGSEENQRLKMQNGAIQVLSKFRREVRKLPEPAKSCRQRRLEAKKAASEKKNKKQQLPETPDKITKDVSLQGNKAIPKQEVKPTIKKESFDHFQAVNGALDGYPPLGNAKMCPDPYSMNGAYPSYPGPYARGSLPSNSQSSTHSPINGFHPNLQGMPYNYYNYAPKGLLSPGVLGYVGHNGTCSKVAGENQKTTIQSLQARLVQNHAANQHRQQGVDMTNHSYLHQSETSASPAPPKHTPSAPPDQMHRVTPIIKQEPMELPLYDSRTDGQVRSCPVTPSVTPLPNTWPGHTPNGSLGSKDWDASLRPGQIHAPFTPEKQRLHQQHHSQLQHSKYAQKQQQWRSYPGTPVASPDLSLALKTGPTSAPSPHPATPLVWSNPAPSPQPKAWGQPGALDYSLGGLRQGTPVGACPDKMMAEAADIRGSTPLDLQEKAWKSGGASAAGSNPSPAPEGRLFPDALQNVTAQACWDSEVESEREPEEEEVWSDSEHNFLDPNIGGVAVAPAHCSILIECARRELHATTPLKKPDRTHPTRISLVFYQHKNLNQPCHGLALWEAKMKLLAERARQRQQEAALLGLSQEDIKAYAKKRKWADGIVNSTSEPIKDKRDGVTRLAPTQHTTTIVTASPYAFTRVTGPYSCFM